MVASADPPGKETRIVPVRTAIVELEATVNVIVPGLVPDVAPSATQGVEVDAAHGHTSAVLFVAVKLKLPPAAGTFCDAGDSVYAQAGARTSTKSTRVFPTTVMAFSRV